jgi:hypothetical protein
MAKKEEKVEEVKVVAPKVLAIEVLFGNGDLNLLRDKINELVKLNA